MNSESGQRLSMEELKRRNAPQSMVPQICPSQEEWRELLHRLDELERHTEAHTALLREITWQWERSSTPAQMEALAQNVAQIRALLQPAGRKNGRWHSQCPKKLLRLRLPHPTWFVLLMTLAVLLLLWWAWAGDWSSLSRLRL